MKSTKFLSTVLLVLLVSPILLHGILTVMPGTGSYFVASQSMAPAISAGSLIFVVDTGQYGVGDVVTFQRAGKSVTHRIVETKGDTYVTKGDGNDGRDVPIAHDQIVGEVVLSLPLYGYLLAIASTPLGVGLLVVVPALVLLRSELQQYTDK